jgi:uncharacterized protein YndB with AHSA1/START domain
MRATDVGDSANATTMDRTSDRELVITRTFNAPPRIVFEAWTNPEFVRRWWAPRSHGVSIVSCDADVRVGGRYRYLLRHAKGDFAFAGQYREVTPHSLLVYTESFEPDAQPADEGGAAVITVTFSERSGRTDLVSHSLFPSKDVLDAVIASGMESGMRETMDQLDGLVASLAATPEGA